MVYSFVPRYTGKSTMNLLSFGFVQTVLKLGTLITKCVDAILICLVFLAWCLIK